MNKSGLTITISGKEIQVNRPKPISDVEVVPFNKGENPQFALDDLVEGYYVLVLDFYSTGLAILRELKKYLNKKYTDQSFKGQREYRSEYHELSNRLLLEVNNQKLSVKKAPEIGWLKILYPDLEGFLLSVPQIQGLNSSWQWYEKGISIPVLDRKIHPWFGTYFPTRFEHLELFENYLERYSGEKKTAIDIGTGSGILLFQLLKHEFGKVYATDSNPNAIIGLNEDLNKNSLHSEIELKHGDLFTDINIKADLIVFNPPWLPASYNAEGIDRAIYYDSDLFTRFFEQAIEHLNPNGKVILLFSNLAQISKLRENHPIEMELLKGGRFEKEILVQKKLRSASKKTKRNLIHRTSELVELWVLRIADKK